MRESKEKEWERAKKRNGRERYQRKGIGSFIEDIYSILASVFWLFF